MHAQEIVDLSSLSTGLSKKTRISTKQISTKAEVSLFSYFHRENRWKVFDFFILS